MTDSEKLEKASKKKYFTFSYTYTRHNPQLGEYECKSEVIASSEKEAEKLARKACEGTLYGYNQFNEITGASPALKLNEDYRLELTRDRLASGRYSKTTYVKAYKIYHC